MIKTVIREIKFLLFILILPANLSGQERGMDYHTVLMANPALTGSEGNGNLRLSYMSFYPGYSFNLHRISISYDGYFSAVHGGAGFYLSNNYLGGIVNELSGGFSYSYYFRAGDDLFVASGLSASFMQRGFSVSDIVLPDQIDPLLGAVLTSSQTLTDMKKSIFDLSAGSMIFYRKFFGGISVSHLAQPDLSASSSYESRLYRSLLIHMSGDIELNGNGTLILHPAGKYEIQRGYFCGGAGAALEMKVISASAMLFYNNLNQADIQSGISVRVKGAKLFYAYRFNISGGEMLLPVSILHNTGIAISLNNVDKRKTVKTINFPEL